MKGRSTGLAAGIVVAVALMVPASAGAATVTIGSPLTSSFTNNPAGGTATNAMVSGPNLASPVDGTVVNWHTQNFVGTLILRVLKLGPATSASAVASSQPIALNGGMVDTPLNVPIHRGEIVGFENTSPADRADVAEDSPTYTSAFWAALPDNGPPQPPTDANVPLEFAYNATVRYCLVPAVTGLKLGAARQALTDAACSLGTVTKKKAKKKKKKLKGKKIVTSQSVPPGTSLGDQAAVDVHIKIKPKKRKKK